MKDVNFKLGTTIRSGSDGIKSGKEIGRVLVDNSVVEDILPLDILEVIMFYSTSNVVTLECK
uniref:Uncharacterized protein n=1 Tax=Salix viminalis TaxID=40686 RepID=A0A6N2L5K2_SALVM